MKLDFIICADDGMMEAREIGKLYSILQIGDKCKATVDGENLISGNLYECLDACNNHANIQGR